MHGYGSIRFNDGIGKLVFLCAEMRIINTHYFNSLEKFYVLKYEETEMLTNSEQFFKPHLGLIAHTF